MAGVFLEDWNPKRKDIVDLRDASIVAVPDSEVRVAGVSAIFTLGPVDGHFKVRPVVGPDNSLDEGAVMGLMRSAITSIRIEQFYISPSWGDSTNLYLDEAIKAARRGVEVEILLDSSWYNIDANDTMDNDDVVDAIQDLARIEGIPLTAKLANAASHGLLKFHNKGIIVDRQKVLVSSLNWNLNSVNENREVGLVVENAQIAGFLADVFDYDWKDDVTPPVADAGQDQVVLVGKDVVLVSTGSWDDVGIIAYHWDVGGDGFFEENGSVATWCFEEPGIYKVVLVVEDAWGNMANDSVIITVLPRPPPPAPGRSDHPWWILAVLASLSVFSAAAFVLLRRK